MSETCALCGVDLNPLTGSLETAQSKVELLRRWDVDVPSPVCASCFNKLLTVAERRFGPEFFYEDDPPADLLKKIEDRTDRIEVWTYDPYPKGSVMNLGLVSGHVVLGTGPLFSITAAVTDFLGKKSYEYGEKIAEAERECLKLLKKEASAKGAYAVTGLSVSYTEIGHSGGMIAVNMLGTAVAFHRIAVP
jgi:uncharacterized protein YbjQ (UPF0145 family)